MDLKEIKDPKFLKELDNKQCMELAYDIRNFLVQSISKTGGHLSSNLGVVELTIAMHKVFDAPKDKIIFDVGHQGYVHKILTGRAKQFDTLRQFNGLSGFLSMKESEYDCWESGHSSTSLSAAYALATARDLNKEKYQVIAVIGDGSLTGGIAFEALNNIGTNNHKVIIIFNDNNMSISSNVGGLSNAFSHMRSSESYLGVKKSLKNSLNKNNVGKVILKGMTSVRDSLKKEIIKDTIFGQFGIDYLGPINGHSFKELNAAFEMAKQHHDSIVIHVVTKKGKGYAPAEKDTTGVWHGVGKFNPSTGKIVASIAEGMDSWSSITANELIDLAKKDHKICVVTPAMLHGSCLEKFQDLYPERTFDVGIAEEHAMTYAAGLAISGFKPFISIYSSFLQRCFDQIQQDVCKMDLPVIIGVDRAGIVGEDGPTHQGIYDIAFLRSIPNLVIAQPKDSNELVGLLRCATKYSHPFAIRYPRGVVSKPTNEIPNIEVGKWELFTSLSKNKVIITYGQNIPHLQKKIIDNQLDIALVNARFFKPIDEEMLLNIVQEYPKIYIYETDSEIGGLSEAIFSCLNKNQVTKYIKTFNIKDQFVPAGSIPELRKYMHINTDYVLNKVIEDQ